MVPPLSSYSVQVAPVFLSLVCVSPVAALDIMSMIRALNLERL